MMYKLKVLQQGLEQEETSHKATRARLADKSKISESIEGAKSEAMKGKEGPLREPVNQQKSHDRPLSAKS